MNWAAMPENVSPACTSTTALAAAVCAPATVLPKAKPRALTHAHKGTRRRPDAATAGLDLASASA